jgi:hypothetical protein
MASAVWRSPRGGYMDNSKDQSKARFNAGSATMMSPRGRFVVAILFSLVSLGLAFVAVDRGFTEAMLGIGWKAATGTVTKVTQTRSRSVTSHWVSYAFEVEGRKYERRRAFGLLKQETEIRANDRPAFSEGAAIDILYSRLTPSINVPVNDPYRNDNSISICIGTLLFGFLAVHLFKNLRNNS